MKLFPRFAYFRQESQSRSDPLALTPWLTRSRTDPVPIRTCPYTYLQLFFARLVCVSRTRKLLKDGEFPWAAVYPTPTSFSPSFLPLLQLAFVLLLLFVIPLPFSNGNFPILVKTLPAFPLPCQCLAIKGGNARPLRECHGVLAFLASRHADASRRGVAQRREAL